MDDFSRELRALEARLRSHPRIEVFRFDVRAPASAGDLAAAEDAIRRRLPEDVRAFYAAHDGVFAEWGVRDASYETHTEPFGFPDYGAPPGCINLVPVTVAMSASWASDSHVNEIDADHEQLLFGAPILPKPPVQAVCIDNYSKYNHGDMLFGAPEHEPVVVVSTDHGADMDSSNLVSFATYLDMTLALHGLCRYKHGIGIGWLADPVRVTTWTKRPSLDELLATLDEDADDTEDD